MNQTPTANSSRPPAKGLLLLAELRAPFFTGSAIPVLFGTALAYYHTGTCDWLLFSACLLGTVLIHAGANVANDYYDHRTGNDEANVDFVRPFTGGSRLIQKGLLTPAEVLALSLVCFAAGGAIGFWLFWRLGFPILVLGLLGAAGGFFYSAPPLFLASRGLGEAIVAFNFGVLPTVGAYFVQTRHISGTAAFLSLPLATLIAAVLFINQFQDCRADAAVGKRNWVVRLGRKKAAPVYGVLMAVWTLPIIAGLILRLLPLATLPALLIVLPAVKAVTIARRHYDEPQALAPANALTILSHAGVGLLLTLGMILGR